MTSYGVILDINYEELTRDDKLDTHLNTIHNVFKDFHFQRISDNVYLGTTDVIAPVLCVQKLKENYPWFANSLESARVIRITDSYDLSNV